MRGFASAVWPLLLGFAAVILPAALYFLSVASFQSFYFDLIGYAVKNYHRSRSLPFPPIYLKGLENLEIYLPILLAAISLYLALAPGPLFKAGTQSVRSRYRRLENGAAL